MGKTVGARNNFEKYWHCFTFSFIENFGYTRGAILFYVFHPNAIRPKTRRERKLYHFNDEFGENRRNLYSIQYLQYLYNLSYFRPFDFRRNTQQHRSILQEGIVISDYTYRWNRFEDTRFFFFLFKSTGFIFIIIVTIMWI